MKSEPDVWSIDQQKKAGAKGAPWDGVRNYQAAKNLKSMKKGDLCFFYHSNIGKEIVGIVEVVKEAFLDPTDKKKMFVAIKVKFKKKLGTKGAPWDGVRNYQAAKNLKAMKKGDQCFFYHSNIGKEIVGIVEVIKEAYLDKTDQSGRFVAVTVKFVKKLQKPISLKNIKKNKELSHLSLIKQSRLSVMPIDSKSWKILHNMSKL